MVDRVDRLNYNTIKARVGSSKAKSLTGLLRLVFYLTQIIANSSSDDFSNNIAHNRQGIVLADHTVFGTTISFLKYT